MQASTLPGRIGRRPPRHPRQAGFNLVELMVVIAVMAALMGIAIPSFQYVSNSGRVSGPANELLASLQLARMESVRRGQRTVVCRSDNADQATPACTTTAGNWPGWIAFIDTDRDGTFDAGEVLLRATSVNAPATVTPSAAVSGASNQVVFRPDGFSRTNAGALLAAQIRVCVATTTPTENARDVAITAGSRFSVLRVNGAGACATPANS